MSSSNTNSQLASLRALMALRAKTNNTVKQINSITAKLINKYDNLNAKNRNLINNALNATTNTYKAPMRRKNPNFFYFDTLGHK